ncbi:MAG: hypothetical protein EAZ99_15940 [Alphaproteobacteria bacterium]|nr:MAG: hypothetical protein EAZ99_15940 [Alphaproteobacteria bacterium]
MRCAVYLLILLAASPAFGRDGLYRGTQTCEAAGSSPGFTIEWRATVRDGRLVSERGQRDQENWERVEGVVGPDGRVTLNGVYRFQGERPIRLAGRVSAAGLEVAGERGPRSCRVVASSPPPASVAQPYRLLPDVAEQRRAFTRSARTVTCDAPPDPVSDVVVEPFYRKDDPTHSIIDPAALERRRQAAMPFETYSRGLARIGDAVLVSGAQNPALGTCLLGWLDHWASAGAMLGRVTMQGGFERKWTLATIALNLPLLTPDQRASAAGQRVLAWVRDLGWAVAPAYTASRSTAANNNHLNWAVLAVLSAGLATEDPALVDWAVDRLDHALSLIEPDGSLPFELARGAKAVHYHAFAVEPTVLAVALLAANGLDMADAHGGALHRLVRFVRDGMADPSPVAARVGMPQDFFHSQTPRPNRYGWAEIYLARYPDPVLAARLAEVRGDGLVTVWLGGSTTWRYGKR